MSVISDADLIVAVREGDEAAAAELFARHRDAGLRLATALTGRARADDLVSEAYLRILTSLGDGRGPGRAFRPYLLSTIRNLFIDELRSTGREIPVEEFNSDTPELVQPDDFEGRFDTSAMARAFQSLPLRWREVLWHTAVEDEPLSVVAMHLGMNANSVAALSFRAREGLRRAYLAQHLAEGQDPACSWVVERLPRRARGSLSASEEARIDEHLKTCERCSAAVLELDAINTHLGSLLFPALVGAGVSLRLYRPAPWWTGVSEAVGAVTVSAVSVVVAVALALGVTAAEPARVNSLQAAPTSVAPHRQPIQPSATLRLRTHRPVLPHATADATASASSTTAPESPSRVAGPRVYVHVDEPGPTTHPPRHPTASPTPEQVDVAMGQAWQRGTGTFRDGVHVQVPITGWGAALTLRVVMSGVDDSEVHRNGEFGRWTCQPEGEVLTCLLPPGSPDTTDFAVDLSVLAGQQASLAFDVAAPGLLDPSPADNSLVVTVEPHRVSPGNRRRHG